MPNDQTPSTRIAGTLRLGGLTPVSRPEKPVDEKKAAPPPDVDAKPKLENLYPVMKATWPHLFMPDAPVPLAEGVHFEMAKALVVSKHAVGRVLKGWVNRPEYLRAMTSGEDRIGLDGEPNGVVTEDQAAWARIKLKKKLKLKPGTQDEPRRSITDGCHTTRQGHVA